MVDTAIEIRDPDYIWSSARVVEVKTGENDAGNIVSAVKVRYDGWGPDWDEWVPFPSPRLARPFTYTRRVRSLVNMLSKKKSKPIKNGGGGKRVGNGGKAGGGTPTKAATSHCSLWPCAVSFRMPHPSGSGDRRPRAEELLRLEPNVFVVPYEPHLLPRHSYASLNHGGRWMNSNRLRKWRERADDGGSGGSGGAPSDRSMGLGTLPDGFEAAHRAGADDGGTPGTLPRRALEAGSLLSSRYRPREAGGRARAADGPGAFTGEMTEEGVPPLPPPADADVVVADAVSSGSSVANDRETSSSSSSERKKKGNTSARGDDANRTVEKRLEEQIAVSFLLRGRGGAGEASRPSGGEIDRLFSREE